MRRGAARAVTAGVLLTGLLAALCPGAASAFTAAVTAPAAATGATTATWFRCLDAATGTGAQLVWSLQDGAAAGVTGRGSYGGYASGRWDAAAPASSDDGPCPRDGQTGSGAGRAVTLAAGTGGATTQYSTSVPAGSTLGFELWFRTSQHQGMLVGLREANPAAGTPPVRDRVVFLTATGAVVAGLAPAGGPHAVAASPAGTDWADGAWHHVLVTQSPSGLRLYLDGALAGSSPQATGYAYSSANPRVGYDDLTSWTADGAVQGQFIGQLAWFSAWSTELSARQALEQCRAGRTAASLATTGPGDATCRP